MRILITAGGTIVKIDDVRHIGNFSTGSFPSKIANAALSRGHMVIYFHAKNAKIPDTHKNLKRIPYETYDDYARELKKIFHRYSIDIAFLGAAVSDYGVKQYKGKISSSKPSLAIKLFRLPKIIQSVKCWSKQPLFQVGFKLLSDVPEQDLIDCAYASGLENKSDLTIANDLKKILSKKRETILITPERGTIKFKEPFIAERIIEFVEVRTSCHHFQTVLTENRTIIEKYKRETALFRTQLHKLYMAGFMPDFFKGSYAGHGSLALRVSNHSFLITSRGSNKKNIQFNEIVLVRRVDWKKRKIFVESTHQKKASLNAVLVAALLEKFPSINAVVHAHRFKKKVPTTEFPYAPGTEEYATKPLGLFQKDVRLINLNSHGLIAVGSDLNETVDYVLR